jgi:hypothetical protein
MVGILVFNPGEYLSNESVNFVYEDLFLTRFSQVQYFFIINHTVGGKFVLNILNSKIGLQGNTLQYNCFSLYWYFLFTKKYKFGSGKIS